MSIYHNKYLKYKSKYFKLKDINNIYNFSNIYKLKGAGNNICENLNMTNKQAINEAYLYDFINDIKENTNSETKLGINIQDEDYEIYYNEYTSVNILSNTYNIILKCTSNELCSIQFNGINYETYASFFNITNYINITKLKNIICDTLKIMNLYKSNIINARGIYMLINILIKDSRQQQYIHDFKDDIWMEKPSLNNMELNVYHTHIENKITIKLNSNKTNILEVRFNNSVSSYDNIKKELYEKDGKWYNIINPLMYFTIKQKCLYIKRTTINYHEVILDLYPEYVLDFVIDIHNRINKRDGINELFGHYFKNSSFSNLNDNLENIGIDAGGISQQFFVTLLKKIFDNSDNRILKYNNSKYPNHRNLNIIKTNYIIKTYVDLMEKYHNSLKNIGILLDYIFRYNTNPANSSSNRFILVNVVPNNYFTIFKEKNISYIKDTIPLYLLEICFDYHKIGVSFLLHNYLENNLLEQLFELFNVELITNSHKYTSEYYFINLLFYLNNIPESYTIEDNLKMFIKDFISKNKISETDFNNIMIICNMDKDDGEYLEIIDYNSFINVIKELNDIFYFEYANCISIAQYIYNGFNNDIKEALEDSSKDVGLIIQGNLFSQLNWDNIIKTNCTINTIGSNQLLLLNKRIDWLKQKLKEYSTDSTNEQLKWLKQFVFFITSSESLREDSKITIFPSSNELFKSHTCFNQLDIPVIPNMTYKKFHEILSNVIISAGSTYTDA